MNTTIFTKTRGGWEAEDLVQINATHSLKITTSKSARGGLRTSAIAIEPTATGFIWQPSSDFSKAVLFDADARCTEKTVRVHHAKAMEDAEVVRLQALAFYAAKLPEAA